MAEVSVSKRYGVSAQEMWGRIGDPGALCEWHPAVESTEVVDAGKARVNTLVGGGRVAETILKHTHRRHSWRIDESPLPMNDFVGSISVRDDAGLACVVECDATFEPDGVSEAEAAEMVRQFFQGGLDAL